MKLTFLILCLLMMVHFSKCQDCKVINGISVYTRDCTCVNRIPQFDLANLVQKLKLNKVPIFKYDPTITDLDNAQGKEAFVRLGNSFGTTTFRLACCFHSVKFALDSLNNYDFINVERIVFPSDSIAYEVYNLIGGKYQIPVLWKYIPNWVWLLKENEIVFIESENYPVEHEYIKRIESILFDQ
ncbi:MAG: hypothetical protein AAF388_00715 [Bacteroidota bacterium]